jgi:hypothetical protein
VGYGKKVAKDAKKLAWLNIALCNEIVKRKVLNF